jgi:uncharacterized C2H2 Zn-finger protein
LKKSLKRVRSDSDLEAQDCLEYDMSVSDEIQKRDYIMVICSVCGQMIAVNRNATSEVHRQQGAYIRHLHKGHGISLSVARQICANAPLQTVVLPSLRTPEDRWMRARLMWAEDKNVAEIASAYGVTEKAMRSRIQRWRRERGWFPARAA